MPGRTPTGRRVSGWAWLTAGVLAVVVGGWIALGVRHGRIDVTCDEVDVEAEILIVRERGPRVRRAVRRLARCAPERQDACDAIVHALVYGEGAAIYQPARHAILLLDKRAVPALLRAIHAGAWQTRYAVDMLGEVGDDDPRVVHILQVVSRSAASGAIRDGYGIRRAADAALVRLGAEVPAATR